MKRSKTSGNTQNPDPNIPLQPPSQKPTARPRVNIQQLDNFDQIQLQLQYDDQIIKKDVMISMQGLGRVGTLVAEHQMQIDYYVLQDNCKQNIQILCKLVKSAKPQWPTAKLILAKYNIFETDLLEILTPQIQNEQLSYWTIMLMNLLTYQPPEVATVDDRETLRKANVEYKKSCLRTKTIETLGVHLTNLSKLQTLGLSQEQFLEGILSLIRNLLQIENDESNEYLHESFMINCLREKLLDKLFVFIMDKREHLRGRNEMLVLEILYHILCCIDPNEIFTVWQPFKVRKDLVSAMEQIDVRHTSRGRWAHNPRIMESLKKFNLNLNPPPKSTTQQSQKQQTSYKYHTKPQDFNNKDYQQLRPKRKQLRQVKILERPFLPPYAMVQKFDNDKTIREVIVKYLNHILEMRILNNFMVFIRPSLKQREIYVTEDHVVKYLMLGRWASQLVVARYRVSKEKCESLEERAKLKMRCFNIEAMVDPFNLILMYNTIHREMAKPSKKMVNLSNYLAGIMAFQSYIVFILEAAGSIDTHEMEYGEKLGEQVLKLDVTKVLKQGFLSILHYQILKRLIYTTNKYFELMHKFGKGKLLHCNTSKLERKKKQNQVIQDEYGYELQEQNTKRPFKIRQYTEKSQFSFLAQYEIIQKYISFIEGNSYNDNDKRFNEIIFAFFDKIVGLLDAPWMFYQADFLLVFHRILHDRPFVEEYDMSLRWMGKVVKEFTKVVSRNPFAVVESLFRYDTIKVKDDVLNNYENWEDEEEVELNVEKKQEGEVEGEVGGEQEREVRRGKIEAEYDREEKGDDIKEVKLKKKKKDRDYVEKVEKKNRKASKQDELDDVSDEDEYEGIDYSDEQEKSKERQKEKEKQQQRNKKDKKKNRLISRKIQKKEEESDDDPY